MNRLSAVHALDAFQDKARPFCGNPDLRIANLQTLTALGETGTVATEMAMGQNPSRISSEHPNPH